MTEKELAVQAYLANRELELGQFFLSVLLVRQENKQALIDDKKPITAAELFSMTTEEQLFADFFNNEKAFVKDMDLLTLRAHREELRKIAFEARARLTATDDEERSRKAKKGQATGFQQNLQSDDVATDAINKVRERGKRLSKEERLIENMMKLPGMDRKTAEMMVQAGTIKATLDSKFGKTETDSVEENKPFSNPFGKPSDKLTETSDSSPQVEVSLNQETNTVVIKETITEEVTKPAFVNPFAKG